MGDLVDLTVNTVENDSCNSTLRQRKGNWFCYDSMREEFEKYQNPSSSTAGSSSSTSTAQYLQPISLTSNQYNTNMLKRQNNDLQKKFNRANGNFFSTDYGGPNAKYSRYNYGSSATTSHVVVVPATQTQLQEDPSALTSSLSHVEIPETPIQSQEDPSALTSSLSHVEIPETPIQSQEDPSVLTSSLSHVEIPETPIQSQEDPSVVTSSLSHVEIPATQIQPPPALSQEEIVFPATQLPIEELAFPPTQLPIEELAFPPTQAQPTDVPSTSNNQETANIPMQNGRRQAMCRKCMRHNVIQPVKGHSRNCEFRFCDCEICTQPGQPRRNFKQPNIRAPPPARVPAANLNRDIELACSGKASSSTAKVAPATSSTQEVHENGIIWRKFSPKMDEAFLTYAGNDVHGNSVYVGRAYHNNNLLPAQIVPKLNSITITHQGQEHKMQAGEVLIDSGYAWKKVENRNIPHNAIFGGINDDGETQHIGRSLKGNSMLVGRVCKDGCLYVSFGKNQIKLENYEILVRETEVKKSKRSASIAPISECVVCLDVAPIVGIFMECGHACLCDNCVVKINLNRNSNDKVNCSICRRECYRVRLIHFA